MTVQSPCVAVENGEARETRRRADGVALVFLATIAWSLGGVFTRLLQTDVLTAIAWRSFFGGVFLLIPYLALHRRRSWIVFRAIGRAGLALAACQVVCQASTVGAFFLTSIANVTLIYATAPFVAAGISWIWMGERMSARTALAGALSLIGVAVIVGGGVGAGHALGDFLALVMTLSFAFVIIIPRRHSTLPMMPTTILSAFATTALFAPFGSAAAMALQDWVVLAGFGLTNFTVALFLFLHGARRIPAGHAALVGTLELVFAPLFVALLFGEIPSTMSLAGGGLILAVVLGHSLIELRGGSLSVPDQALPIGPGRDAGPPGEGPGEGGKLGIAQQQGDLG